MKMELLFHIFKIVLCILLFVNLTFILCEAGVFKKIKKYYLICKVNTNIMHVCVFYETYQLITA